MSFSCEHCYFRNTEIQSAGQIQEQGASTTLILRSLKDMERQIVKSDTAEVFLQELDITIPPGRGKLTNAEGLLSEVLRDLKGDQDWRKQHEPETWAQIESLTQRLNRVILGESFPFTIRVDDIAGNSFIEPFESDTQGATYIRKTYPRNTEANEKLGLFAQGEDNSSKGINGAESNDASKIVAHVIPQIQAGEGMDDVDILENQRYTLETNCPGCTKKAEMNIQMVKIPFFKQVVLSAVSCDFCGYRTSDVKSGGEVSEMGTRIYLDVKSPIDIRRDILKSESCLLKIPACGVEVVPGTMGGRFTTVEGLLTQIRDDLKAQIFDIGDADAAGGDSMETAKKRAWDEFFAKMDLAITGEMTYVVILEDPLSNSYVQNLCAPNPDPQLKTETYERTEEEEDELGLKDMKTKQGLNGEYIKEVLEKKRHSMNDIDKKTNAAKSAPRDLLREHPDDVVTPGTA